MGLISLGRCLLGLGLVGEQSKGRWPAEHLKFGFEFSPQVDRIIMRYLYSNCIERHRYRDDGLADNIHLRIHKDSHNEVIGTLRAQKDWSQLVTPIHKYHGGLGDKFSFVSVTIPECLPERLEIASYANEFAFLYDDQMEQLDLKDFRDGRDDILGVFGRYREDVKGGVYRPEKILQLQIFEEMMAIDHDRAIVTMQFWTKFVVLASRTRVKSFNTLSSYLPSRTIDAGELFWFGLLTFAMALTIPAHELDTCMRLARPGYEAISLINDVYSWPKEHAEARRAGQDYVFNAVWVVMEEQKCDEQKAVRICKSLARKCVQDFTHIIDSPQATKLSHDSRTYLDAVKLSYVGNLVWSIYSPRYNTVAGVPG